MGTSSVDNWLAGAGFGPDYQWVPLSGGDINETGLLTTDTGQQFCIKQNDAAGEDFFAAEAHGLQCLQEANALRVPDVIHCEPSLLVLEYIASGSPNQSFWEALGDGLAKQHRVTRTTHGLDRDNYCGLTPQPNTTHTDGYEFFAEQRLGYQAQLAVDNGRLSNTEANRIERLAGKLADYIPLQPPSLLHGDLWRGNIHCDITGQPVLIDPAVYYGWREADIAMTQLFGGFAPAFYDAYNHNYPLEPGWRERLPLYNLYHLLNHLNLFGGGYHSQVISVLKRFT